MSNERYIWFDDKIVPVSEAKVNVLSPTAQFGTNVFEGIRCYWNDSDKQLYAFKLDEHYKRLKNSIKVFRIEDKYTLEELKSAFVDVIKANNYKEDIAVRQTIFIDGFGSWHSHGPTNMFVAPIPRFTYLPNQKKGLKCLISSWRRISEANMSPKVKAGANYVNSRVAHLEALENGYDAAIMMNDLGKISEGTGSCLFIVRDSKLITPSITSSILESITRDTIIEIARDILKLEVVEREVDRTELYICDEAFLCGSAMEVTAVTSVDGIDINNGEHGTITNKILEIYLDIAKGKYEQYKKWLTPIY